MNTENIIKEAFRKNRETGKGVAIDLGTISSRSFVLKENSEPFFDTIARSLDLPRLPITRDGRSSDQTHFRNSPSLGRMIGLDDIKHHFKKWKSPVTSKKKGKHKCELKLQSDKRHLETLKHFSETTNGLTSLKFTHIDPKRLFAALVENETLRQYQNDSNATLQKILSVRLGNNHSIYHIADTHKFYWSSACVGGEKETFTHLFQHIFDCSYLDALATLAHIVGMSFTNTFSLHETEQHITGKNGNWKLENYLPTSLAVNFDGKQEHVILERLVEIRGHGGQTISGIAIYRSRNDIVSLPVSTAYGKLTIGKNKVPAHFYNQALVDSKPSATVFLCQNIDDALILEQQFENLNEVVVVGHYGHDLELLPWNFFSERKVVLICALNIYCYVQVEDYKARLVEAGVTDFTVHPYPILNGKTPDDLDEFKGKFLSLEQELLKNAVYVKELNSAVFFKEKIIDGALSFKGYKEWGENVGFFVKSKRDIPSAANSIVPYSPSEDFTYSPEAFSDITWDHIQPREGVCFICAKKNVGKTHALLGLLKARIYNSFFLGMKTSAIPENLIVFDSETISSVHAVKRKQFEIVGSWQTIIHGILKKAPDENAELKEFELGNLDSMDEMKAFAQKKSAHHVIIDNITSAVKTEKSIYAPEFVKNTYAWSESLNSIGIGLTLVHHLHETHKNSLDGAVRGSDEWLIRAHTILILIGKKEILSNKEKYPEIVIGKCSKSGATIGIYFQTCKLANILEETILWAHLPQNAADWELLAHTDAEGNELKDSLCTVPVDAEVVPTATEQTSVIEQDDTVPTDMLSNGTGIVSHKPLTYEEKSVVKLFDENDYIKTSDAMEALRCGETKAREHIKSLIVKEYVKGEGVGKAKKYVLIK